MYGRPRGGLRYCDIRTRVIILKRCTVCHVKFLCILSLIDERLDIGRVQDHCSPSDGPAVFVNVLDTLFHILILLVTAGFRDHQLSLRLIDLGLCRIDCSLCLVDADLSLIDLDQKVHDSDR